MTFDLALRTILRFIHISSVVIFVGGIFYARQVLLPTLIALPQGIREQAAQNSHSRFRGPLFTLLALIIGSGLYNLLTGPRHGREYHALFGVKMLLVAHIAATAILWATGPAAESDASAKGGRRLLSITISALLAILISAYLRTHG